MTARLVLIPGDGQTDRRPAGEARAHARRQAELDSLARCVSLAHRRLDQLDAGLSPFLAGDPVVSPMPARITRRIAAALVS